MFDDRQKMFHDNPNPNAKIGFVIFYPFQFYVEKNIYKHLKDDAEFIIDLGVFFPVEQPHELLMSIVTLLNKVNAHYRILYYEDYFYQEYLERFFFQYKVLVSLWERGCLELDCNVVSKRKVRLGYGSGKELTMYRPSGRAFDLTLAYGPRDAKAFSLLCETKIVGIPKFDDWFNNEFDEDFLRDIKKKLDPGKKTILYLPTHSDLGSIKDLAEPLLGLTEEYNVIAKLHYLNVTDEPELVEKLEHSDVILFKDDTDLLPLLKIADGVVSDNSSAIFDALLADKPLVVTDFFDKEFIDVTHKKVKWYRRGKTSGLTYSGSIEQKIKKEGLVITIQKPEQLSNGVKRSLEDPVFYKEARKKINQELVAFFDGKSGERAASAIRNILTADTLPEKPPLYHALEIFENNLNINSFFKWKSDIEKISEYKSLLLKEVHEDYEQEVLFSIIVLCQDKDSEFFKYTLRSLLEQEFPCHNYEIILVNGPSLKEVRSMLQEIPGPQKTFPTIKYVEGSGQGFEGTLLEHALKKETQGRYVCFTESGYVAPADWLIHFFKGYKKYPDIAGVGGYLYTHQSKRGIYDMYYSIELMKRLGIEKEGGLGLARLFEVKNDFFYQNPVGTFANMSYRRELVQAMAINYSHISLLRLAELMMKEKILKEGYSLLFIPFAVKNLKKLTFKNFTQKTFEEGLAYYIFCSMVPGLKKYYTYSLFSLLREPLSGVFYPDLKLYGVVGAGTFFRWLGKIYGILLAQKNKIDEDLSRQV